MFDAWILLGVIEDLLGINPNRGILNLKLRTLKATKLRVFKLRLKLLTLNHFHHFEKGIPWFGRPPIYGNSR